MRKAFLIPFLLLLLFCKKGEESQKTLYTESHIQPVVLQEDITTSRENAIVRAAKRTGPSVVCITVTQVRLVTSLFDDFFRDFFDFYRPRRYREEEIKGIGSGVIINSYGHILTNAHVVENATEIKITLSDGKQYSAELVGIDNVMDLALLKIPGKDFPYAVLGNSEDLMIGEWVIALGNPFAFYLEDTKPSVTVGVVSALYRSVKSQDKYFKDMIQTDAAINLGNSGGPLVNARGEVIGINTFIFSTSRGSEGIGFAIPINRAKEFIKNIEKYKEEESSIQKVDTKIGLEVTEISSYLMRKYRLARKTGVVVVKVKPGSLGNELGIREGDVIIRVNNVNIRTPEQFKSLADRMGRRVEMIIDRKGSQFNLFYHF